MNVETLQRLVIEARRLYKENPRSELANQVKRYEDMLADALELERQQRQRAVEQENQRRNDAAMMEAKYGPLSKPAQQSMPSPMATRIAASGIQSAPGGEGAVEDRIRQLKASFGSK